MQHHGKMGGLEGSKNFLCFAQSISEKHRGFVFFESFVAKLNDCSERLLCRWKLVAWQPVGGLHDERFSLRNRGRL